MKHKKNTKIYKEIGEDLVKRIMSGEFSSTTRLPSERELSDFYEVGRAIIRDSLIMLEVKGIVEIIQGSGIYITRRTLETLALGVNYTSEVNFSDTISNAGPFELLQARQWIESHVARLAATNLTDYDLKFIEEAYEDHLEAPFGEVKEGLDLRFHLAIARASKSSELVGVVSYLWSRRDNNPLWQQLNARIKDQRYRDRWVLDHKNIVLAMRARSPEDAYVAMWTHIGNVNNYLKSIIDFHPAHSVSQDL